MVEPRSPAPSALASRGPSPAPAFGSSARGGLRLPAQAWTRHPVRRRAPTQRWVCDASAPWACLHFGGPTPAPVGVVVRQEVPPFKVAGPSASRGDAFGFRRTSICTDLERLRSPREGGLGRAAADLGRCPRDGTMDAALQEQGSPGEQRAWTTGNGGSRQRTLARSKALKSNEPW